MIAASPSACDRMSSAPPTLLVVTGLQREARIARGPGVVTVCSGGNALLLQKRLSALAPAARPGSGASKRRATVSEPNPGPNLGPNPRQKPKH